MPRPWAMSVVRGQGASIRKARPVPIESSTGQEGAVPGITHLEGIQSYEEQKEARHGGMED